MITLQFIIDKLWFQKHQSECLFNAVECPNEGCKEKLTRRDMNNHKITECVWRGVSCEYCRGTFIVKNKQFCEQRYILYSIYKGSVSNLCFLFEVEKWWRLSFFIKSRFCWALGIYSYSIENLIQLGLNVRFENFDPLLIKMWVFYFINFVSTTACLYWSISIRRNEFWKYFSDKNFFSIFFSDIITSVKSLRFNVPTIVVWEIFHEKR